MLLAITSISNVLEKVNHAVDAPEGLDDDTSCWAPLPQLLWNLLLAESADFIQDLWVGAVSVYGGKKTIRIEDSEEGKLDYVPVSELALCTYTCLLLFTLAGGGGGPVRGLWGSEVRSSISVVLEHGSTSLPSALCSSTRGNKPFTVTDYHPSWWLPSRLMTAFVALQEQVCENDDVVDEGGREGRW